MKPHIRASSHRYFAQILSASSFSLTWLFPVIWIFLRAKIRIEATEHRVFFIWCIIWEIIVLMVHIHVSFNTWVVLDMLICQKLFFNISSSKRASYHSLRNFLLGWRFEDIFGHENRILLRNLIVRQLFLHKVRDKDSRWKLSKDNKNQS